MAKRIYAALILFFVVATSIFIMILPSFATKGISRISLHQELQLPLILNDEKDIKLVFFGYAGCADICTPRLQDLASFYKELPTATKKRVGVEFLDISIPEDSALPNDFAKFFHKDFKGIYLNKKILRDYTKEFQVFFSQGLFNKKEFDHSTNLYIIKKTKKTKELRYIYTSYPFDFQQITLDIEELTNE